MKKILPRFRRLTQLLWPFNTHRRNTKIENLLEFGCIVLYAEILNDLHVNKCTNKTENRFVLNEPMSSRPDLATLRRTIIMAI